MTPRNAYYAGMAEVSIVGAAGYTGQETLDRVLGHPQLDLVAIGSDSLAGQSAGALDPRLADAALPGFVTNEAALAHEADVTIICLSHEVAAAIDVPRNGVVVDLSGAHRLRDGASYETWYGFVHPRPDELGDWAYGLPELVAEAGRLIANPGCYATATLLALAPLRHAIEPGSVVVDGLSGMTGAGRTLKSSSHAGSVLENVSPYRVGAHQHVPEIAQLLGFPVSFTPHLLPVRRGLIATCNVRSTGPDLRALLEAAYADSAVVTVLPEGMAPELARVQHTDRAEIGVFSDRFTDRTIVICAEDNLGKGAAGQAIQNVNRALRLEDTAGLRLAGVLV
jgi:N-acetyl-gamma-glutamyl-phosphate reductase